MVEVTPVIERSDRKLMFSSGKSKYGFFGIMAIAAIFAFAAVTKSTPADFRAVAFVLALLACIALPDASRQWTAEFDLATRRMRIVRRSFGRRARTIVDCSFDECIALGTFEYNSDGHLSYDVYVKSGSGTRHTIPTAHSTLNDAARLASQLAASTGIPRVDIHSGPIYIRPDDDTSPKGN